MNSPELFEKKNQDPLLEALLKENLFSPEKSRNFFDTFYRQGDDRWGAYRPSPKLRRPADWTPEERECFLRRELAAQALVADRHLPFKVAAALSRAGVWVEPARVTLSLSVQAYRALWESGRISHDALIEGCPNPDLCEQDGDIHFPIGGLTCAVSACEQCWLTYLDPVSGEGIAIVLSELSAQLLAPQ